MNQHTKRNPRRLIVVVDYDLIPAPKELPKVLRFELCAACGEPVQGNYAVHRDGFGDGPEVDLCDRCGGFETPTLPQLWAMIANRRKGCSS